MSSGFSGYRYFNFSFMNLLTDLRMFFHRRFSELNTIAAQCAYGVNRNSLSYPMDSTYPPQPIIAQIKLVENHYWSCATTPGSRQVSLNPSRTEVIIHSRQKD